MIATEILALAEIARGLVSRKSELDQKYFEQFIQPAWEAFVKIHEDYKASFKEYAVLIASEETPVEIILERIRHDSIYTADLRSTLSKLVKYLPGANFKTKDQYLSDFARAIIRYFDVETFISISHNKRKDGYDIVYDDSPDHINANIARSILFRDLSRNRENHRSTGKKAIDTIMKELQIRHERVADSYYLLRKTLLS